MHLKLLYRPIAIGILFFSLSCFGGLALYNLPVSLLPEISYPGIVVQTSYLQGSPEEIEQLITEPLEQELATVKGLTHLEAVSRQGLSVLTLKFKWETDMMEAQLAVRERLARLRETLPKDISPSRVFHIDPSSLPMMKLTVASEAHGLSGLYEFSENVLRRRFEQIEGVGLVQVEGGNEKIVDIRLNTERCQKYGIRPEDIQRKIEANNNKSANGVIRSGQSRIPLKISVEFQTLDDLKTLPIVNRNGQMTLLGQLAEIEYGIYEKTASVFHQNTPVILLNVIKNPAFNTLDLSEKVREAIRLLNTEYNDLQLSVIYDDSKFVRESIGGVFSSLIWGAVFAFLILVLFLKNLKYPLQVGIAIPVSILLTFIFMYFQELSLNMMSLGGLALGIGMLVDNSIVVLENIVRLKKEKPLETAIVQGTKEVAMPVTASTLTSISVFAPLLLIPGVGGALFKEQSLTIIYSLCMSLFVSLVLLPVLVFQFEKRAVNKENLFQSPKSVLNLPAWILAYLRWATKECFLAINSVGRSLKIPVFLHFFDGLITNANRIYHDALIALLRFRKFVLLFGFLLALLSIWGFTALPKTWIPSVNRGALTVECEFPPGLRVSAVEEQTRLLSDAILKQKSVKGFVVLNGKISRQFADQATLKEEKSIFLVESDRENLQELKWALHLLFKQFPQIKYTVQPILTPFELMFQQMNAENILVLNAENRFELEQAKQTLISKGYVFQNDIESQSIRFRIDQEKLAYYGISSSDIKSSIEYFSKGLYSGTIPNSNKQIPIYIRPKTQEPIEQYILRSDKLELPLAAVLTKESETSKSTLIKSNQAYTEYLLVQNSEDEFKTLTELFKNNDRISVRKSHQANETETAIERLQLIILLAVALVYMIMAAQFESLKDPFIVLLTLPMGVIGVVFFLWATGTEISLISMMGMVVLVGIVVNDAIVKIDFINQKRGEGLDVVSAIMEASEKRFRPIIMTTLTTVLALLPMMFMQNEGIELRFPLAITIFGGLSVATVLTLIFIPVLYVLFNPQKTTRVQGYHSALLKPRHIRK